MIEEIDIDVDIRDGDHGTDSAVGELRFSEEVKLPADKSDCDEIVCDSLQITQAGLGVAMASVDDVLVHTEPTTDELVGWVEDNVESAD